MENNKLTDLQRNTAMKVTITRTYKFNDTQIKKFMTDNGYVDENNNPKFTEEELENELEGASADDLESYGSYDSLWGQDIDIEEDKTDPKNSQ